MKHIVVLVAFALAGTPAMAQDRFLYEHGPSGQPPAMYSTPYDPYQNYDAIQRPVEPMPQPLDRGLPTIDPYEPYSTGRSLPSIEDREPVWGPGPPQPPDPVPAYQRFIFEDD
jgi:hypothetical protein